MTVHFALTRPLEDGRTLTLRFMEKDLELAARTYVAALAMYEDPSEVHLAVIEGRPQDAHVNQEQGPGPGVYLVPDVRS